MTNFHEMALPEQLIAVLDKLNFVLPTPIQEKSIPFALKNRDILGSAQTGTGKTLAFGIPLISKLINSAESRALIITPTRELAQQVMESLRVLLECDRRIKICLLIGGEPFPKQFKDLRNNPRIIVGTPGRIIDHINRGSLSCAKTDFLVLDEMDRMFDMGFGIQIEKIINTMPVKRQTLMFSATLLPDVAKLAGKYLNDPERVSIGSVIAPAEMVEQEFVHTSESGKYNELLIQLQKREGSVIIFVSTKFGAEDLADKLYDENYSVSAIHGDLRQQKRQKVINAFRIGKIRIMVATDVAARGLDIPHIQHVINYNIPQCPEDYIHRIGRTARAGAKGFSLCFVAPKDSKKLRAIKQIMDPATKESDLKSSSLINNNARSSNRNNRFYDSTKKSRNTRSGAPSKGRIESNNWKKSSNNSKELLFAKKDSFLGQKTDSQNLFKESEYSSQKRYDNNGQKSRFNNKNYSDKKKPSSNTSFSGNGDISNKEDRYGRESFSNKKLGGASNNNYNGSKPKFGLQRRDSKKNYH